MTTLRTAAQQALEALEDAQRHHYALRHAETDILIAALRAALAEPVQEPVAWRYQDARGNYRYRGYVQGFEKEYWRLKPVPLYAAPPQRKPLTEEEIKALIDSVDGLGIGRHIMHKVARAIERAHGIGGNDE